MGKLGASYLRDEGFELQRVNNFEIHLDLTGVPNVAESESIITLGVVSGFLPNESNEVITLNYGNTQITVAGAARPNNSGSLVVRDFIGKDTEGIIDAWRALVYNKGNDAIGFAADYKKTAKITQTAPDGSYLRSWDLVGVWPSAVDYGQVSNDSPGVKTVSITLQYDKATIDRSKWSAGHNIQTEY